MTVTPQGNVYLCKTKLENDYKNQLTFSNLTAQLNYFNSTIQQTFDNYTYVKKDGIIKVGANIDSIIDCNYLFYKNTGFTTKYYFCFITNMEYINENCTAITIETDCFQTWQFELQYKRCFVEREHVSDDTLGLHTLDEGFNIGEPVINSHLRDTYNRGNQRIIVAANIEPSDGQKVYAGAYQGIPAGFRYFSYPANGQGLDQVVQHILLCENRQGDINQLFMAPEWLAGDSILMFNSDHPVIQNLGISRISSLNGYTPKNKKLLCFPFSYILLSNGQGQDAVLHQELWNLDNNNEMVARMEGCLTAGCSIRLTPLNYNGDDHSNIYGINLGKFPQISWSTDPYVNWLTENGVNNVTNIVSGLVRMASGDVIGGALQGGEAAYRWDVASQVPPQVKGNTNAGDVMWATGENCFHVYRMTAKAEVAKVIDDYFSMYGYKVNVNKVPNVTGRTNWNYVKTRDCNVEGDIPQTDLNIIKSMFNNGVTLWHSSSTMLDYSQSNSIVS